MKIAITMKSNIPNRNKVILKYLLYLKHYHSLLFSWITPRIQSKITLTYFWNLNTNTTNPNFPTMMRYNKKHLTSQVWVHFSISGTHMIYFKKTIKLLLVTKQNTIHIDTDNQKWQLITNDSWAVRSEIENVNYQFRTLVYNLWRKPSPSIQSNSRCLVIYVAPKMSTWMVMKTFYNNFVRWNSSSLNNLIIAKEIVLLYLVWSLETLDVTMNNPLLFFFTKKYALYIFITLFRMWQNK